MASPRRTVIIAGTQESGEIEPSLLKKEILQAFFDTLQRRAVDD